MSLMIMSLTLLGSLKLLFWQRSKTGRTPHIAEIDILNDRKMSVSGFGDVSGMVPRM